MPSKKPLPAPSTAARKSTQPPASPKDTPGALNPRRQAANRWQRSKRYGWDSR